MARKKIALIGAGMIGGTLAHLRALKRLGDVVLFDVIEGLPQGKALDLLEAGPDRGLRRRINGTNDYADIAGADVCIVTAGVARKPGMSRDDLLGINAKIITTSPRQSRSTRRDAFVIVVTNPLDAMVTLMKQVTGFPKQRVVGMAGVLDSARYRTFLARELGVSVESVAGDGARRPRRRHGAGPEPRHGQRHPGRDADLAPTASTRSRSATRRRAARSSTLLKTGSAFYSPAPAAIQMAEAYLFDKKQILPCAALLEGEYGVRGLYVGVPVQIGAGGVEKVVEIALTRGREEGARRPPSRTCASWSRPSQKLLDGLRRHASVNVQRV